MSEDNVIHVFEPSLAEQFPRPDEPDCECTEDRVLLPCDWGWRCGDCNLPVPAWES